MPGKRSVPANFIFTVAMISILMFSVSCGKSVNKKDVSVPPPPVQEDYTVAAYYFPNWHPEPRIEKIMGKGWSEWELVKAATPRFEGHNQPKVPLWGYEDESDPAVMSKKIDAAVSNGVDVFIFDWYWFDNQPFLERPLDEAFLTVNNGRMKFSLMWANHALFEMFPVGSKEKAKKALSDTLTSEVFDKLTDHIVNYYFKNPAYWKIDGCPCFSIFELFRLVDNLGGAENTKKALDRFREKTKAAGFPDIHLNAITLGLKVPESEKKIKTVEELVSYLGINSVTSYLWVHDVPMDNFPKNEYADMTAKAIKSWSDLAVKYSKIPFYPNVSVGFDSSPRTDQKGPFKNSDYPYMATFANNTPENFYKALNAAKTYLSGKPVDQRILTINAWNEWTEGSYLEPDTTNGMKYLESLKAVFGKASSDSLK